MKIYLIRHGIAEDHSTKPDADRVLTDRGKEKMAKAVEGMRKLGIQLDLILSSPLKRARQTADVVATGLSVGKLEEVAELSPGTNPSLMVNAIRRYRECKAIALVGHEPDLSRLASFLLTGSANSCDFDFKKGGMAGIDAEVSGNSLHCILASFLPPKVLRAL
jgi:phosphohistidine phosphatase